MRPAEESSLERPITTEGQLLVEGRVPEMFFREMVAAYDLENLLEVRTFGDISKDNLQTYLEIFAQKAAFKQKVKRLGIIRDAEGEPAVSAFQSVQAALRGAQLPVPGEMNKMEGAPLGAGIYILPNCQDVGMLEELCLAAATEAEKGQPNGVFPCVDDFFSCLEKRGRNASNPAKSRFAGFALACDVIDPQLGRAAQKGVIPWHTNAFDTLKSFLQKVAGQ
jgi:hypothetical protein